MVYTFYHIRKYLAPIGLPRHRCGQSGWRPRTYKLLVKGIVAEQLKRDGTPLPWTRAAPSALLALTFVLFLAVVFNVAIGRTIHWDIVAALAGVGFVGLTLAFRYVR